MAQIKIFRRETRFLRKFYAFDHSDGCCGGQCRTLLLIMSWQRPLLGWLHMAIATQNAPSCSRGGNGSSIVYLLSLT